MEAISPGFPLLTIVKGYSVKLINDEKEMNSFRFSDLYYQTEQQYAFDNFGSKWRFKLTAPDHKPSFWDQFRNPGIKGVITWERIGSYSIDELKRTLCAEVDCNEVMTEFESNKFIKSKIQSSYSLNDVLNVLKKYVLNVNEMELWREQEQR